MRAREREKLQRTLDVEMRPFRQAGKDESPTNGLLRAVRTALKVPVTEIAAAMGVNRSGVFDLEARELTNSATLRSMSRMAEAMGCKVVYGIVPCYAGSFERLAEERRWKKKLRKEEMESAVAAEPDGGE
jgi:sugar phosphate isomerase/epimerase